MSRKGFTLIELLIVLGILAVLLTTAVLLLNPAEFMAQGRDSKRISDLKSLDTAISLVKNSLTETLTDSTSPNLVYISLPDTNGNLSDDCRASGEYPDLPVLSGWFYRCMATSFNLKKVDGTGWLPITFTSVSTNPLTVLPIDPVNNQNNYYAYSWDGSSKATVWAKLESSKYLTSHANNAQGDGGNDDGAFETWPIAWATGGGTTALVFDGVNDYVEVLNASTLNLTDEMSVEFWFRPDHVTMPPGPYILSAVIDKLNLVADAGWSISYDNDEDYWFSQGYTGGGGLIQLYIQDIGAIGETVQPGGVYHIVGTYNTNVTPRLKFYLNGFLVNSYVGTGGSIKNTVKNIYFGADPLGTGGSNNSFEGALYKTRLYNRALSSTEVNEHYQGIFNDNTGLLAKWNFDEGLGSTTNDSSGNGHNGTLKPSCPNCPTWASL